MKDLKIALVNRLGDLRAVALVQGTASLGLATETFASWLRACAAIFNLKGRESMRTFLGFCLFACIGVASILAFSQSATIGPKPESATQPAKVTVEGLVRDIACPIQNPQATATHLNMKCLRVCARAGSPLIILTKNGDLYVPISNQMPDVSQSKKLVPFLGKYVRVTGSAYERNGSRAITIDKIEELKNVRLTVEDP